MGQRLSKNTSTQAVHAGEERYKPYGALTTPIVQTSTYTFTDSAAVVDFMRHKASPEGSTRDEYGRYGNPTQQAAERKLAALDGAEEAVLFSSGMAAISTSLLGVLRAGDHVIVASGIYRRTVDLVRNYLPRWGIDCTLVDLAHPGDVEAMVRPNTRLIFGEVPSNPYLRIPDLPQLVELARRHKILTAIDSTFATPVNLRPLEYGVDLVIHSATKYLGGHNDLLAGVALGSTQLLAPIREARGVLGPITSPHDAYLLLRGTKTLPLRVQRQNTSALSIASFLEQQPAVRRVYYPGLPSHPDYAIASRLMNGFGGVISFEIDGDVNTTSRFIDCLRLPYIGPTLGGVESIVQQQALFISLDPRERAISGISDSLIRYAVGIEDAEDIMADLRQAFEHLLA